jgi:hypothetical protein
MKTAGEVLKQRRLSLNYQLSEVAAVTKIQVRYLQALEDNLYQDIPSFTSARGFLKNYGDYLGLPNKELMALFRRDYPLAQNPEIVAHALVRPVNQPRLMWNARFTAYTIISAFLLLVCTYLFYQYSHLTKAPYLRIDSPVDQARFLSSPILVSGRTDPDARVEINSQPVILDKNGDFKSEVNLFSGTNDLLIKAISRRNRETSLHLQIYYQKPTSS